MKHLLNKSVLSYGQFRFLYTSHPECTPLANSSFLLTFLNISTRGRNWPEIWQNAVTVILQFFTPNDRTNVFTPLVFYYTLSQLLTCLLLLVMLKKFPGVSDWLLTVATFSNKLQNVPNLFRYNLTALATYRLSSVVPCSFSFFFEIIWNFHSECAKLFYSLIVILEERCSQFGRQRNWTNDF